MKPPSVVVGFSLVILVSCFGGWPTTAQHAAGAKHPYALGGPITEPLVFGEGVISTGDYESHPAFTPDGKTLYFLKSTPTFSFWTILVSHFRDGKWVTPEVAPFSGQYSDADPFITPDGSKLYFISNRPVDGKSNKPKGDIDIWVVEKNSADWGEPRRLDEPINSGGNEWYPTIARNGTIYFGSDRSGGKGRTDIYRSRLVDGRYGEPENLGDQINSQFNEFEALIAPDESFLIFSAGGRGDGLGGLDLYISYSRDGAWTKPVNLGSQINSAGSELSPYISPDGKYFFWSSTRGFADGFWERRLNHQELMGRLKNPRNGLGDIYQIDIGVLKIERRDN